MQLLYNVCPRCGKQFMFGQDNCSKCGVRRGFFDVVETEAEKKSVLGSLFRDTSHEELAKLRLKVQNLDEEQNEALKIIDTLTARVKKTEENITRVLDLMLSHMSREHR